jgi:hypothetical protein
MLKGCNDRSSRPKVAIERITTVYTMYGNGDLSRQKLCISHAMKFLELHFKKNTYPIVLSVVSRT